ncbi:MAG: cupin domain-containing protein [Pleurocapsa sp. SU_196_0]|nr:cupin domain-containing protein [Pleurocapsa sp. SU_196_0]
MTEHIVTTHAPLETLETRRVNAGKLYLEFLRVPAMSAGLYTLEIGATDPQQPHTEDEIYVVLEGRAQLRIGETDYPANAGDTIFVPALQPHQFHDILETLKVIVVFAPAEYSRRA